MSRIPGAFEDTGSDEENASYSRGVYDTLMDLAAEGDSEDDPDFEPSEGDDEVTASEVLMEDEIDDDDMEDVNDNDDDGDEGNGLDNTNGAENRNTSQLELAFDRK